MPLPATSVVVATHRRRPLLGRLLDALEAQDWPGEGFEVVVVDDGSDDGTWELLQHRAGGVSGAVRRLLPIRIDPAGPATARNRGWRASSGEVIAFTDDDCRPDPAWLANLVGRLQASGAGMAQGVTRPDPSEWDGSGPFARTMWVLEEDGFYATCNMAYQRDVLERVGGFDGRFRRAFGEDTDLAWRAIEAGTGTVFAPEALVFHEVWPSSWRAHLRDQVRREGIVLALRQHPRLRDRFYRPVWYQGSHPRALGAALGLLLAAGGVRRTPAAALAGAALAAPYVHYRLYRRRLPCRARNLPVVVALALVADLFEVAVLARASLRYRKLLL